MAKDPEQERAEIREQLPASGRREEDNDDPEGHEPLPGVVGDRIKEASEPRTSKDLEGFAKTAARHRLEQRVT